MSDLPDLDRRALRRRLVAERPTIGTPAVHRALDDRLRGWLGGRTESVVGAYWPVRGEFDPLPALEAWRAAAPGRRVGLPVVEPVAKAMRFLEWYPGCPMGEDAYGIPEPRGTDPVSPALLLVPCVGFGPGGLRLGYGGGYYDRHLAAADPRPATLGIAFAGAFVPELTAGPHDVPLDAVLTEAGPAG